MSPNIVLIRHGKVDLPYESHDAMPLDVLTKLGRQELDPKSDKAFFDKHTDYFQSILVKYKFKKIYRSTSKRCESLETYIRDLFPKETLEIVVAPELNEINFDIPSLFPDSNPRLEEINQELYAQLLTHKSGVEEIEMILQRIDGFLNTIEPTDSLVLSHGFLLRFMRTYLMLHRDSAALDMTSIESSPRLGYFEGFVMDGESFRIKRDIGLTSVNE